jgi:hypothetical protein
VVVSPDRMLRLFIALTMPWGGLNVRERVTIVLGE